MNETIIKGIRRFARGHSAGAANLRHTCEIAMAKPEYAPQWMREREADRAIRCAAGVAMVAWVRAMSVAS
jgi:hypothetical protein